MNINAPLAAFMYNKYFHAVDRHDQLQSGSYGITTNFRAQKWTIKLFYGLLDMILVNSWILFTCNNPGKAKRGHNDFMEEFISECLNVNFGSFHAPEMDHSLKPFVDNGRFNCVVCAQQNVSQKRRRSSHGCPICMVPLHPECNAMWKHGHDTDPQRRRRSNNMKFS